MIRSNRTARLAQGRQINRAVAAAFEGLEARVVMDATYQSISPTPFTQNWTNTGLIATTGDWSGVPGVIGYRGDDPTTTTAGIDPQTILTPRIDPVNDVPAGVVNVLANQTNPNTNTNGAVAEFDTLADPVVALQGSGTADAPFLLFHVNSTGVANPKISFNLRDIDGSTDNTNMQVAVQYRVGTTGNFTNLAAGYVADATSGPSLATLVTPVSVILPGAAGNQAQLQIRVITTNAAGNDEWVGVDDVVIEAGPAPTGTLIFSAVRYDTTEGDGANTTATIRINRDSGNSGPASVLFETIAGGTASVGGDYTTVSQTVNFTDGQDFADVTVPIVSDDTGEPAETVLVRLSNATGATLGSTGLVNSTLYIADDDTAAPTVVLNEVSVQLPNTDNPYEYAEIRGGNSASLLNTYFFSVEGDQNSNAGAVTLFQDLSSFQLGTNGLLMIRSASGHAPVEAGTTPVVNATLDNPGGGLQNGANSFLVVYSPVAILAGTDLDTNNDGTLDLPAGASVIDGVGWITGVAPLDRAYGTVLTLNNIGGIAPPDAATRFPDDLTPLSSDAWYYGDMTVPDPDPRANTALEYLADSLSTTRPAGLPAGTPALTPGGSNFPVTDTQAPTVAGTYRFDDDPPAVRLSFSEGIQGFTTSDVVLTNLTTGSTVIPTGQLTLTPLGNDYDLKYTGAANGALPDGNYTIGLAAGSVQDLAGNNLAASTISFFVFAGDANRTRGIDIDDFGILAARFNQPGTFSQGDFDYSGQVDIDDFGILAAKFNTSLPAPRLLPSGSPSAVAGVDAKSTFSQRVIDSLLDSTNGDILA